MTKKNAEWTEIMAELKWWMDNVNAGHADAHPSQSHSQPIQTKIFRKVAAIRIPPRLIWTGWPNRRYRFVTVSLPHPIEPSLHPPCAKRKQEKENQMKCKVMGCEHWIISYSCAQDGKHSKFLLGYGTSSCLDLNTKFGGVRFWCAVEAGIEIQWCNVVGNNARQENTSVITTKLARNIDFVMLIRSSDNLPTNILIHISRTFSLAAVITLNILIINKCFAATSFMSHNWQLCKLWLNRTVACSIDFWTQLPQSISLSCGVSYHVSALLIFNAILVLACFDFLVSNSWFYN